MAGFADDGDGVGCGQDEHWGVGVGDADAEVVDAPAVAQGEFAELIDVACSALLGLRISRELCREL